MIRWRLEEFADEEKQQRLWICKDPNPTEMSSFEEACCGIFDDSGLRRALDKGVAAEQFPPGFLLKIHAFDKLLCQIPEDASPGEQIRHPRMTERRIAASELLKHIE